MSPELVELLEAISAFLESGNDVSVHEPLVLASLWVFSLWCDDGSKVFCLVFGLNLCGGVVPVRVLWVCVGLK